MLTSIVVLAAIAASPAWVPPEQARPASSLSTPASTQWTVTESTNGVPTTHPTSSGPAASQAAAPPLSVTRAETVRSACNPSIGQTGDVRFLLSREASVTMSVYGPNHEAIASVVENKTFPAGWHTVSWDGLDREGGVVPNEAWFLTLQAVSGEERVIVDPLLTSGGERIIAADVQSLEDSRRLSYQLPKACRVLVRAAVVDGPLLRTLVNWEPRAAGLCIEHWDGRDSEGLRRILDVQNARIAVMAFALPDLTLITTGNAETTYRDYYDQRSRHWPQKAPVVRLPVSEGVLSPHALLPPHLNRDPRIVVTFPGIDDAPDPEGPPPTSLPIIAARQEPGPPGGEPSTQPTSGPARGEERITPLTAGPVLLRVDLPDPVERDFMNQQKFELIVYVDDRRIIEVEQGHVPFTYPWDTAGLSPGRHVLTINLASFRNHVGTASRVLEIVR